MVFQIQFAYFHSSIIPNFSYDLQTFEYSKVATKPLRLIGVSTSHPYSLETIQVSKLQSIPNRIVSR